MRKRINLINVYLDLIDFPQNKNKNIIIISENNLYIHIFLIVNIKIFFYSLNKMRKILFNLLMNIG